jgi:hypothetical protein
MLKPQRGSKKVKPTSKKDASAETQVNHDSSLPVLSHEESVVLDTFARYLMPPDQMLCLTNIDTPAVKHALQRLIEKGWLTAQSFKGGYALTLEGFNLMNLRRSKRAGNK